MQGRMSGLAWSRSPLLSSMRSLPLALLLGACSASSVQIETSTASSTECFRLVSQPVDEDMATRLSPLLREAVASVERYFGAPFARPFTITILPDRAGFDASCPPEWGIDKSECWMVAAGVADGVRLLSPRVWKKEACEHDAEDELHVRGVLAHELVHVYHGQHNPSPDFVDVAGIDWFVEGLATLASGQLEDERLLSAREALERDLDPKTLAAAWTGRYRYGVSGSLVAFVEHELGRARIPELLGATSGDELLALIGMSEEELLERWRAWVSSAGNARLQPGSSSSVPVGARKEQ